MTEVKNNVNEPIKSENIRLKVSATKSQLIYDFLEHLQKVYPRESISCSQLLENQGEPAGYHLFLKIILPAKTMNVPIEHEKNNAVVDFKEASET